MIVHVKVSQAFVWEGRHFAAREHHPIPREDLARLLEEIAAAPETIRALAREREEAKTALSGAEEAAAAVAARLSEAIEKKESLGSVAEADRAEVERSANAAITAERALMEITAAAQMRAHAAIRSAESEIARLAAMTGVTVTVSRDEAEVCGPFHLAAAAEFAKHLAARGLPDDTPHPCEHTEVQ